MISTFPPIIGMTSSELFLSKKYSLYITQAELDLKRTLVSLNDYDKSVCYGNIATAEYGQLNNNGIQMLNYDLNYCNTMTLRHLSRIRCL